MTIETSNASPSALPPGAAPFAAVVAQLRPAVMALIVLTLVTGCLFPATLYVLGRRLFPDQAAGSLLMRRGVVVGSRLIGQAFTRPIYFQPRPSAAGNGYDATQSGGANLAPANPRLVAAVQQAAGDFRARNGLAPDATIPIDAVTSSGSGLDPHISPANAALQMGRVAASRGVDVSVVRRLVSQHTVGRQLGILGEPRVSVLELNLALDQTAPLRQR
jgi:K+-transporting ATPase ATPase C chain